MTTQAPSAPDLSTSFELFPGAADVKAGTTEEIAHLDLASIEPDPEQPRKDPDAELEAAIRQEGVLVPIVVRPHPDPEKRSAGMYMIVFGERRYRGSIVAGRTTIPAIIRDETDDVRRLIRQLMENMGKRISPIDEASKLGELRDKTRYTINQLVTITGIPKSTINDRLALFEAPAPFKSLFLSGALTSSAAPILRKFSDVPSEMLDAAVDAAKTSFSWDHAIKEGKAISLAEVERVLDQVILGSLLAEIPERLALLYHGPTVKVGSVLYATDLGELKNAQRKHEADVHARQLAEKREAEERREQAKVSTKTIDSPAADVLSPFVINSALAKGLKNKPLHKWPTESLELEIKRAHEQLAKQGWSSSAIKEGRFTRESVTTDLDALTAALDVRRRVNAPPATKAGASKASTAAPTNASQASYEFDRELPRSTTEPARKPTPPTAAENRAREKERKQEAQLERDVAHWNVARPAIRKAIAAAIWKADSSADGRLGEFVQELVAEAATIDDESTRKLLPPVKTAADLIRFIVLAVIDRDIAENELDDISLPVRLNRLGLKVNLRAILDAAEKKAATPAAPAKKPEKSKPPAKRAPSKKVKAKAKAKGKK